MYLAQLISLCLNALRVYDGSLACGFPPSHKAVSHAPPAQPLSDLMATAGSSEPGLAWHQHQHQHIGEVCTVSRMVVR